jgi:hypothetical protein
LPFFRFFGACDFHARNLKARRGPTRAKCPYWRTEARGQQDEARAGVCAIDGAADHPAKLYREALRRMPETMDTLLPLPDACPVTLDELLADEGSAPAWRSWTTRRRSPRRSAPLAVA